ncbi:MAG: 50S ribosomal protein L20 [Planctomycetota bacterium]
MVRTRHGVATRKRKSRLFKRAEGFRGGRKNLNRTAQETVLRAEAFAFRDRKQKKRSFRALWITRLSAALDPHDIRYSRFICGLTKAGYPVNRKALSELSINDPEAFAGVVNIAKQALTD